MTRIIASIVLVLSCATAVAQPSREEDKILGIWLTASRKGKVEIYRCGDKYCGKIVWLKDPLNDEGKAKLDKNNPDDKLKNRTIMGTNILHGFVYDGDMEWDDGEIYDPDNGKTYSCIMSLHPDNKVLEVRGYIGFSLIGRTEEWLRTSLE